MQDFLSPLFAGLTVTIVGGLIFYTFKIRQLYLIQINFFDYGNLPNKNEKILEFKIINKSKFPEEDIIVNLPIEPSYELIGSDYADVSVEKNQIKISRLTQLTEISILILIKGSSNFSNVSPTISSKTTKGTNVKKLSDVPCNYGYLLSFIIVATTVFVGTIYATDYFIEYKQDAETKERENIKSKLLLRFTHLKNIGWDDNQIIAYAMSELSRLYSDYELPVSIKEIKTNGKKNTVVFYINNKTMFDFKVQVSLPKTDVDNATLNHLVFKLGVTVPPNSSAETISEFEITKGTPKQFFYDIFVTFNGKIMHMPYNIAINK